MLFLTVAKDPVPKWRKLVWNDEGSLVAVGHRYMCVCMCWDATFMPLCLDTLTHKHKHTPSLCSSGAVEVFMPSGKCVCTLPGRIFDEDVGQSSLKQSIVGATFIPPHKHQEDSV